MQRRFEDRVDALTRAILEGVGDSTVELRSTVSERAASFARGSEEQRPEDEALPESLRHYVDTVAKHAYRVLDGDVERLLEQGHSQDAIFELTVSAAFGAGLARLQRGLSVLKGHKG